MALLGNNVTEFHPETPQPKIKQEAINDAIITSEQLGEISGKVLDYQFFVKPKQEFVDAKTEPEDDHSLTNLQQKSTEIETDPESLGLTGEIIEFFEEDGKLFNKKVFEEKYLPKDRHFCQECNGTFPFKKHDLHLEYVKILDNIKPRSTRNKKYSCHECDMTFPTYQEAITHLIAHDRTTFDCNFCFYAGKTYSELKCHLQDAHGESLNSKSNPIISCKECDFKTNNRSTMRRHIDAEHSSFTVNCKKCDEYWPDLDHTLHKKIKHITRKKITADNPFVCRKCKIKLVDTDEIYEHLKIHDDIGYYCNFCDFSGNKQKDLTIHEQKEHLDQLDQYLEKEESSTDDYACTICNRLWPNRNHETHLRMLKIMDKGVSDTKPFNCSGCCRVITNINRVYYHLRLACKKFQCNKCPFIAKNKRNMERHNIAVHPKPNQVKRSIYSCNVCDFKSHHKPVLKGHKKIHNGENEKVYYYCDVCNFKTGHASHLKGHKSRVHQPTENKQTINCTDCSYVTTDIKLYRRHRTRLHSNIFYKCSSCTYQGTSKMYLERHRVLKHSTSKENKQKTVYVCEQCGVNYKSKPSLTKHMIKVHNSHSLGTMELTEAKKLKCPSCKYETCIKSYLELHIRNKHERTDDRRLYCANCDYSTFLKTNLIQHMVKHMDPSKMQMHKCIFCSFTTKRPHTLRHHIKTHGLAQSEKKCL